MMNDFVYKTAKPLPVILMLDVSGSMSNNMDTLNSAVRDMLRAFKEASTSDVSISVAIITFDSNANLELPLTDAGKIDIEEINYSAGGCTALGEALTIAKDMLEDKSVIPSRAYRPTVILLTDGYPNDSWKEPMRTFTDEGRSSKTFRMAMGIGTDSESEAVLKRFVSKNQEIFRAKDASGITKFFQFVTMSTTSRTVSANPNLIPDSSTVAANFVKNTIEEDDDLSDLLPY